MRTSQQGIDLIKHYESLNDGDLSEVGLQPKMDPKGIWTEGYGHAMVYQGIFLNGAENKKLAENLTTVHSEPDAVRVLAYDLAKVEQTIDSLDLNLSQNQFDAIVSITYNIGYGNFSQSTLLRRIVMKSDDEMITDAFLMWNKCAGQVLAGLTFRRQSEALLFTTGELKFFNN